MSDEFYPRPFNKIIYVFVFSFCEGFKEAETACCGSGRYRGNPSCGGKGEVKEFGLCDNVSDYFFFDSFHPTEKAYKQLAKLMWSGDSGITEPYNLKELFEF